MVMRTAIPFRWCGEIEHRWVGGGQDLVEVWQRQEDRQVALAFRVMDLSRPGKAAYGSGYGRIAPAAHASLAATATTCRSVVAPAYQPQRTGSRFIAAT